MPLFVVRTVYVADQPNLPNIYLLQAGFDEAAAGIDVVIGELLLHLGQTQPIRDQLIRVDPYLILARRTAEGGHIHDIRDGLQVLLHYPVFDGLQLHHVILRIGAAQREEIDLSDRAPVRAHLRHHARRQGHLRKTLQDSLAIPAVLRVVIEDQLQVGEPEDGERAQMGHPGYAVHDVFQRNRHLLLDLFRGDSRPLRDDLDIVVGHVRIRFHRKLVERHRAQRE